MARLSGAKPKRARSLSSTWLVPGATGVEQRETLYDITSLLPDPKKIAHAVRSHWGIENSLHWCLDVGFSENASQKSAGHAARNFLLLNRIALNLIKANPHKRLGIRSRRKKAGWDRNYLLKLLKDSRVIDNEEI